MAGDEILADQPIVQMGRLLMILTSTKHVQYKQKKVHASEHGIEHKPRENTTDCQCQLALV